MACDVGELADRVELAQCYELIARLLDDWPFTAP